MTFRIHILSLLICLAMAAPLGGYAQSRGAHTERARYARELRNYKHEFLIRELQLSDQQQEPFFALYDAMEDEKDTLNSQMRTLEQQINANPNASEVELATAAATLFAQKEREGAIEQRYFEEFKTVLTPRQLFLLKGAERQFNRSVMRRHRHASGQNQR